MCIRNSAITTSTATIAAVAATTTNTATSAAAATTIATAATATSDTYAMPAPHQQKFQQEIGYYNASLMTRVEYFHIYFDCGCFGKSIQTVTQECQEAEYYRVISFSPYRCHY